MLDWSETDLAETVLHELAHATLWIRGDASFNETYASVVGETAALQWLDHRYGPVSAVRVAFHREQADYAAYRGMLREVYRELDALYADPTLTDDDKLTRKQVVLGGLEERLDDLDLHELERWRRALERSPWNNARLMGYRTYDTGRADFDALMDACGGDISAFIDRVQALSKGAHTPRAALRAGLRDGC